MHTLVTALYLWLAGHPLVAAGCALALGLMLWKQPRQTLKLLLAVGVLVLLGYMVSGLAHFVMHESAVKERMVQQPAEQ